MRRARSCKFSSLLLFFLPQKIQASGQYEKLLWIKLLYTDNRLSIFRYFANLLNELICLEARLHMSVTWDLKFKLSSNVTPRTLISSVGYKMLLWTERGMDTPPFLDNIIHWNLSGLATIWFSWNHVTAALASFTRSIFKFSIHSFLAATKQLNKWYFPSVCPSVRLSVCLSVRHTFFTMFPSSYHHEIFRSYYQWQKWRPCKRSRSEVKGQGHIGHNPT